MDFEKIKCVINDLISESFSENSEIIITLTVIFNFPNVN